MRWNSAQVIFLVLTLASCLPVAAGHGTSFATQNNGSVPLSFQGLPSDLVKNYPIPTPGSTPNAIVTGADNNTLWFTEYNGSKIGEFDIAIGKVIREYPMNAGTAPATLAIDQRGLIWITDQNQNDPSIWSLNSTTGVFTQYPTGVSPSDPIFVFVDPATNNVWFTDYYGNYIGEISGTTHVMAKHFLSSPNSYPVELGKQNGTNYLWITEETGNIARFDMSTGNTQQFSPSVPIIYPVGIVVDKQGNVWVSEHGGSSIIEFMPGNSSWRKYPTAQATSTPGTGVATLAMDQQGRLWFAEHYSNRIGRLDPDTGVLEEFDLPILGAYSLLDTVDRKGNFWFTEAYANQIGMIPGNATTDLEVKAVNASGVSVTAGSSTVSEFAVTNNNQTSSLTVDLNVTSSFTTNYYTTRSEVSLSNYTMTLGPGQTKTVNATLTPDFGLGSAVYAAGVVASIGSVSSTGTVFLQVNGNPWHLLETLIPWILIAAGAALLGVFLFFRLRKKPRLSRDVSVPKTTAAVGLAALLLTVIQEIGSAAAKCPGLPPPPGGGPDPYGIALDIGSVAFFALVAYFLIRSRLRAPNPQP